MKPVERSLQVFGVYLIGIGAALLFAPNLLLGVFGIAPTEEVWIRVLGLVAGILGVYYVIAAVHALRPFYRPTVILRTLAFITFLALALLKLGPPQLVIFGVIDLLAALWTWRALQREPRA
jgi:hypothetical protein